MTSRMNPSKSSGKRISAARMCFWCAAIFRLISGWKITQRVKRPSASSNSVSASKARPIYRGCVIAYHYAVIVYIISIRHIARRIVVILNGSVPQEVS